MKFQLTFLLTLLCYLAKSQTPTPNPEDSHDIGYFHEPSIQFINGEYGVWYKRGNNPCYEKIIDTIKANTEGKITKPFIIVEGIDFVGTNTPKTTYGAINQEGNDKGILEVLREDGWDIIVLSFEDNTTDMRRNAKLVEQLIVKINKEVEDNHAQYGTPIHRPMIMGVSMGGIIVRYCLASMEHDDTDHKVEKYISFDSPHKGANVPLGLQHFIDTHLQGNSAIMARHALPGFMENILKAVDPVYWVKNLVGGNVIHNLYDAEAALQLVMSVTECSNHSRSEFLGSLSSVGSYPKKCRNIALANGASGTGHRQMGLEPGSKLFKLETPEVCVRQRVPGDLIVYPWVDITFCPVRSLSHTVYAMPGGVHGLPGGSVGPGAVCEWIAPIPLEDVKLVSAYAYEIEFFPRATASSNLPLIPDLSIPRQSVTFNAGRSNWHRNTESKFGNKNVDHVAGGYYPLFDTISKFGGKAYDIDLSLTLIDETFNLPVMGEIKVKIEIGLDLEVSEPSLEYKPHFSFIPTVSALDINTSNWEYNTAELGNYPHDKSTTPFDAIYTHYKNSQHGFIDMTNSSTAMPAFLLEELSPEQLYIQNRTFEDGYVNTFESRNFIAIGNEVDPITNRTKPGNVIIKPGASVTFSVPTGLNDPNAGFVYFDDGFDSDGGNVEVIFNELPNCGERLLASASDDIAPDPDWQSMKRGKLIYTEPEQRNPFTNLVPFDEAAADAKHLRNRHFEASVLPNPFSEQLKINVLLPESTSLHATILDMSGNVVKNIKLADALSAGSHELEITNIESINAGIYLLQIQTEKDSKFIKVVKQ